MPAAGSGVRLGGGVPKALREVGGRSLLGWALSTLEPVCDVLVVAAPADSVDLVAQACPAVLVVAGGPTRSASVRLALAAVPDSVRYVLVHDAARPLAPTAVARTVLAALREGAQAVVPVLPVHDTVKVVDADGWVLDTPDRLRLRAVQTPQGFYREVLARAHAQAGDATDDAGLVEALGVPVLTVPGHPDAFKVTTAADFAALTARLPATGS